METVLQPAGIPVERLHETVQERLLGPREMIHVQTAGRTHILLRAAVRIPRAEQRLPMLFGQFCRTLILARQHQCIRLQERLALGVAQQKPLPVFRQLHDAFHIGRMGVDAVPGHRRQVVHRKPRPADAGSRGMQVFEDVALKQSMDVLERTNHHHVHALGCGDLNARDEAVGPRARELWRDIMVGDGNIAQVTLRNLRQLRNGALAIGPACVVMERRLDAVVLYVQMRTAAGAAEQVSCRCVFGREGIHHRSVYCTRGCAQEKHQIPA